MTITKRLGKLEARAAGDGLSVLARAWLGHDLTPEERQQVQQEAAQFVRPASDAERKAMSKEAREWLAA